MKKVSFNVEFAGVVLPVAEDNSGNEVVPLKPISDIFGLSWSDQHKKVKQPNMAKRLGVIIGDIPHDLPGRQQVCIRLDRVVTYLFMINPDKVRGAGNLKGADFLESKQEEWDEVLHQYEVATGTLSQNDHLKQEASRIRKLNSLLSINREMRLTQDVYARQQLSSMAAELAEELGVPYQVEMAEALSVTTVAKLAEELADKSLRAKVIKFIDARLKATA